MMECSICGISDSKRLVFRAVSPKGIVWVCESCAAAEGFPMVKEPKPELEEPRKTVYERLSIMAGIKPKPQEKGVILQTDEKSIRQIVNKNYEEKIRKQAGIQQRNDLVDNFHWILMRVRRMRGLTQGQLAERIEEPEAAVKMAEQGVVPEGYKLLDKLESFLGVKLIRERFGFPQLHPVPVIHHIQQNPQKEVWHTMSLAELPKIEKLVEKPVVQKKLNFNKETLNSLTIADLKRMKEEREARQKEEKEEHN